MAEQPESAMSAPFLVGDRLYLRPLETGDLPVLRPWWNDAEIRGMTGEVLPTSRAAADAFLERVRTDKERVWLVVVLKEGEQVIGEAGLLRIFTPWRTADMSIIIGDKTAWGKGYGREVAQLMLDFAFGYLNLHRLAVGVVAWNERAMHFWQAVGFRKEGVHRDGYYFNHAYHDFVLMSILEDEFRAQKQGQGG